MSGYKAHVSRHLIRLSWRQGVNLNVVLDKSFFPVVGVKLLTSLCSYSCHFLPSISVASLFPLSLLFFKSIVRQSCHLNRGLPLVSCNLMVSVSPLCSAISRLSFWPSVLSFSSSSMQFSHLSKLQFQCLLLALPFSFSPLSLHQLFSHVCNLDICDFQMLSLFILLIYLSDFFCVK